MAKLNLKGVEELARVEKKILVLLMMIAIILVVGTSTFMYLEHQTLGEAIFSTLSSAVGHGFEYQSRLTVIITSVLMITEWACLWLSFEAVVSGISEGKVREIVGGVKMKKKIESMRDHYVLCGFGRVGAEIAKNLHKHNLVVVDKDSHAVKEALDSGYVSIQGDVFSEDTLRAAGVDKAKTVIAATGSDSDNVFITLTAKGINPNIRVISRADRDETVKKLKQAGATEVVNPAAIGGKAMAEAVLQGSK